MTKRLLPLATMEALLRQAGAERVSEDAKEALKRILEVEADKLGKDAVKTALLDGRKTVKGSDFRK